MESKLKIRDLLCEGSSVSHVTKAGMNIFAELGFPPEEAEKLFADSNRIIKEKLQARAESKSGDSRKIKAKRS
jgi:hypothetical protein